MTGAIIMSMLGTMAAPGTVSGVHAQESWQYGLQGHKGWNSSTYSAIHNSGSDGKTDSNWRHALATANGKLGVLESGDPEEDVFIFQNTKLILDGEQIMTAPDISASIDQQRANSVSRDNIGYWQGQVKEYNKTTYGVDNHLSSNTRPYHPAAQLRIKNNDYTDANKSNYNRYTNFESGEIGAQWKDAGGKEWNRRTFASREDDVIVTVIEAPEGEELNVTLNIDNMLEMGIDDAMKNKAQTTVIPETKEFVKADDNGFHIGQVGKYGLMYIGGKEENGECEYARGGYATAIRMIADDDAVITKGSYTRDIQVQGRFNQDGNASVLEDQTSDNVTVTGTNRLILVSKVDNAKTGLNNIDDVESILYASLLEDVDKVVNKYTSNGQFSYDAALEPHEEIHGGMFREAELNLCTTPEELADRELTNEALMEKQSSDSHINKAWLERLFYNGRYASICSSGYATARLGGIWVGNWMPDWSGDFTLDANVNLQVSGMNTGHLTGVAKGYIDFTLRHVADWEKNAKNIYGIEDAIMAPPRVDGSGNGQLYHMLAGYPFAYWNAGADWLILPIYEYYQCYGNEKIPVGEDIDVAGLKSVLSLDDSDVERIRTEGFDLLHDILRPLTQKLANFWAGYVSDDFYVDSGRQVHLKDGSRIADGGETAEYIFTPGYSPENVPSKDMTGYNSTPSLAANTAMDIAAAHDSLDMARAIAAETEGDAAGAEIEAWDALEAKFPSYLYENDGALKEWALEQFEEQYNHRHVSHTYAAWPGYEAQNDYTLRDGLTTALDMRYKYNVSDNAQAHGHMHNALAEARLKRVTGYEKSLYTLVNSKYQYNNLLTSHNKNRSSAFCTDNAIGLTGAVIEGLMYSNTGEVEILPALISDWKQGNVSGLMTRANAEADTMSWDLDNGTAALTLTSNADNNRIKLTSGLSWTGATINGETADLQQDGNGNAYVTVSLDKGEQAAIVFQLADVTGGTYAITDGVSNGAAPKNNNMAEGASVAMEAMTDTDVSQRFVMDTVTLTAEDIQGGDAFTPGDYVCFNSVATPSCYINMHGRSDYIGKEDGKITLYTDAPNRYNNVFRISEGEDGYVYIETTDCSKLAADSVLAVAKTNVDTNEEYDDRTQDGVRITHQVKQTDDDYQLWKIHRHMGYVTIQNKATGSYISGINTNGEVCQKAPLTDIVPEDSQLWNIKEIQGQSGSYTIQNTYSGRYLAESGSTVVQKRNSDAQWIIQDGRIYTADKAKAVQVQADGTWTLTNQTEQGTVFTFALQKTRESGAVPDRITLSDSAGGQGTIRATVADTVVLKSAVLPAKAEERALNWVAEDAAGSKTGDVTVSPDGTVSLRDSAKGNRYYIYAVSADGSCTSNKIHLIVSGLEVREETIEFEDYDYGFGNYKNEGTNIGTINGEALLKFSNVSVDDLKTIQVVKTKAGSANTIQLYLDAQTDVTADTAYDGIYSQGGTTYDDAGNNGPTAMKRYDPSHRKDYGTAISEEMTIEATAAEKTIPITIPEGITGSHDLYVRINKVSGTWAGNFDYLVLKYSSGEAGTDVMSGDVNDDGRVTAVDALIALKGWTQAITLTDLQEKAADVAEEKGVVDVKDVLGILEMAVNKK